VGSVDKKKDELTIFQKWKETQAKEHFQELYNSMKPLIYDAAKKASYGSNLPESAHRIYAAQAFLDSLRTFNPNSGAQLQTHVYGAVHHKAKRLNYMYQNLAYIPEPRSMRIGVYQNESANLRETLGREPTPTELAAKLDWAVKDVERIQKEVHKDLAMEEGTEEMGVFETPETEEVLDQLYYDLTPEEQQVYDHIFGKRGKVRAVKANKKINFDRIAQATGYSTSKVRAVTNRIKAKFERAAKK
jgi:DNA-directed RNA polymerase specialized sigma subunit